MSSLECHLDSLVRHIQLVQQACLLLGKRLIARGQPELGRLLIARGFVHDASKFYGIEWDYLHNGKDTPKELLDLAIKQHTTTNSHHIEHWGNIELMPRLCIGEMCADWLARAQELGTDLREWIEEVAIKKYHINKDSIQFQWITEFIDILLENDFIEKS